VAQIHNSIEGVDDDASSCRSHHIAMSDAQPSAQRVAVANPNDMRAILGKRWRAVSLAKRPVSRRELSVARRELSVARQVSHPELSGYVAGDDDDARSVRSTICAHPSHICSRTGLIPPTICSGNALATHACHIRTGPGLTFATPIETAGVRPSHTMATRHPQQVDDDDDDRYERRDAVGAGGRGGAYCSAPVLHCSRRPCSARQTACSV
jgi:hypothetical protein